MPSPDKILDATEKAIQRYGPEKTNVVDVARALDISHGTIYRHFPNKDALRDAVLRRWLERIEETLAEISHSERGFSREERLHPWLRRLTEIRRTKRKEEPELFALYRLSDEKARDVTEEHAEHLIEQLTTIVRPDARNNAPSLWNRSYPEVARAIFDTTALFHHPAHADEWDDPEISEKFEAVWRLIRTGLIGPSGLLEES